MKTLGVSKAPRQVLPTINEAVKGEDVFYKNINLFSTKYDKGVFSLVVQLFANFYRTN